MEVFSKGAQAYTFFDFLDQRLELSIIVFPNG
jgi:hypothetical protein